MKIILQSPLFVLIYLILVSQLAGCEGCENSGKLGSNRFSGRWEALKIDGKDLATGRQHFIDIDVEKSTCRFYGIETLTDGSSKKLHDYQRGCMLEKREHGWVMIFDKDKGHFLDLKIENGVFSMILPPQKKGDAPRVLTSLKKAKPGAGELPESNADSEKDK